MKNMKKQVIGILAIALLGFSFTSASRVTEIIQYHFQYWTKMWVEYVSTTNAKWDYSDLWYVLSQSDYFLKENISQLLDSNERSTNLTRYLRDGTSLTNALWYHKNSLNSELQTIANKIQNCENQLSRANQLYTTSLSSRNENGFNQAVQSAQSARSCLWELQAQQSAVKTLLSQVDTYSTLINRRTTYLKNNQSLILKHYDILKPSLLRELYPIAVQLENQSKSL